jgi:hypothetical protein
MRINVVLAVVCSIAVIQAAALGQSVTIQSWSLHARLEGRSPNGGVADDLKTGTLLNSASVSAHLIYTYPPPINASADLGSSSGEISLSAPTWGSIWGAPFPEGYVQTLHFRGYESSVGNTYCYINASVTFEVTQPTWANLQMGAGGINSGANITGPAGFNWHDYLSQYALLAPGVYTAGAGAYAPAAGTPSPGGIQGDLIFIVPEPLGPAILLLSPALLLRRRVRQSRGAA